MCYYFRERERERQRERERERERGVPLIYGNPEKKLNDDWHSYRHMK